MKVSVKFNRVEFNHTIISKSRATPVRIFN